MARVDDLYGRDWDHDGDNDDGQTVLKVPQKQSDRRDNLCRLQAPLQTIQCDGGFNTQAVIDLAFPSHQAKNIQNFTYTGL